MVRKRYVAVDTETFLIRAGRIAPPLVCVSWAERIDGVIRSGLLDHVEGIAFVRALLEDPNVVLIFHNAAFDLAVLAAEDPSLLGLIFAALAAGRIADTMIREQLIMIARGDMGFQNVRVERAVEELVEGEEGDDEEETGESAAWRRMKKNYTLAGLIAHYLRRKLDKGEDDGAESVRLTFDRLRGTPISLWPPKHVAYACDDGVATLEVFELQAPPPANAPPGELAEALAHDLDRLVSPDERMQVGASFALHLCAVRGLRTDAARLKALEEKLLAMQNALGIKLLRAGLLKTKSRKDPTLSRNMKAIRELVAAEFVRRKQPLPLTKGGLTAKAKGEPVVIGKHVSTSKDTIEAAASFPYPEDMPIDVRPDWLSGLDVKWGKDADKREARGLTVDEFEAIRAKHEGAALEPLVMFANTQKILGTYVKPMWQGVNAPMNSRANTLVESGRTSWSAMVLTVSDEEAAAHEAMIEATRIAAGAQPREQARAA